MWTPLSLLSLAIGKVLFASIYSCLPPGSWKPGWIPAHIQPSPWQSPFPACPAAFAVWKPQCPTPLAAPQTHSAALPPPLQDSSPCLAYLHVLTFSLPWAQWQARQKRLPAQYALLGWPGQLRRPECPSEAPSAEAGPRTIPSCLWPSIAAGLRDMRLSAGNASQAVICLAVPSSSCSPFKPAFKPHHGMSTQPSKHEGQAVCTASRSFSHHRTAIVKVAHRVGASATQRLDVDLPGSASSSLSTATSAMPKRSRPQQPARGAACTSSCCFCFVASSTGAASARPTSAAFSAQRSSILRTNLPAQTCRALLDMLRNIPGTPATTRLQPLPARLP